jgi:hypothetical protein
VRAELAVEIGDIAETASERNIDDTVAIEAAADEHAMRAQQSPWRKNSVNVVPSSSNSICKERGESPRGFSFC